jgi:hypothetical protein
VTTFLATLVVLLLVVGGMALGVMVHGRRLRGSCGLTGDDCACSALQARSCQHVRAPQPDGAGSGDA